MDLNTTLSRGEEYVFNEVDGELVMMSIETGDYVSMNETGKIIWELLEQDKTVNELIALLVQQFDVDQEIVKNDVVPFIEQMKTKGILA